MSKTENVDNIEPKADEVELEEMKPAVDPHMPEILRSYDVEALRAMEKKLVRKIDIRTLPILVVLFLLNVLDRNAIANARLGGLEATLRIDDVQYQTAVMVLWGFVQNFPGLVVLRFLVGVTEAPYFPGCIFLLSCWYTKTELPGRIAIFYSGYTLSSAFGGLIAAGIVQGMDGAGGYPSWRWIFIIEGAITVIFAILGYFLLPNYPNNTPWLNEVESALAEYRLTREADGEVDEVKGSVFDGLRQCLVDPKVYLLVLILTATVVSMSFTYFFPSIVQTLGYPTVETLLLTAPPYFASCILSIVLAWHSGRTHERCFHIVFGACVSICGQVISTSTHSTGARYFAMFLQTMGSFSIFQLILSWISSTIPRPKSKRAVAQAMAVAISNATNISTAYLYPAWSAPLYHMACIVLSVALVVCAISSLALRAWLKRLNKALDNADGGERIFRYVL